MSDERDIHDIWAECQAIAARPKSGLPVKVGLAPIAGTVAEAHFRAECEQRPVRSLDRGHNVTLFPIGTRPA